MLSSHEGRAASVNDVVNGRALAVHAETIQAVREYEIWRAEILKNATKPGKDTSRFDG